VRLLASVRRAYRKRRYWQWLIRDERRNPFHPPWSERLRAWRRGFLSRSDRWLGLEGREAGEYLTDLARYLRTSDLNEPYARVLDDKLVFHEVFRRYPGLLPEAYALLRRGTVIPISPTVRIASFDDVLRLLSESGRLVLKPTTGGGGVNVTVLDARRAQDRIALGGVRHTLAEARAFLMTRREQLVTEYVECGEYARAIFPDSSNTVRMLTVWEEETGESFLPYAIHKFGTSRSGGVDNFARGGVAAWVDVESGRMGPAISMGPDGRPVYSPVHPETGAPVEGVIVPRWGQAVDRMLRLARDHPYLPHVGWDLAITDDGLRVFEGNSFTGNEVFQLQRPLLSHPRLRRFYQRRGVVS